MSIIYGAKSLGILRDASPNLQKVFNHLKHTCPQQFDITLVESYREPERQQELYRRGLTKLDGITKLSKHNEFPSLAMDVYPYDSKYGALTGHERNIESIIKKMSPSLDANDNAIEYNRIYKRIEVFIHNRFNIQAGIILSAGMSVGIPLRWGGDWDSDGDTTDQTFIDLPHFEEKT